MAPQQPRDLSPLPNALEVIKNPGPFSSFSKSKVSLPPGELVATLEATTLTPATATYATVQVSRTQHVNLNSDFLYVNSSCDPSLEFHVVKRGAGGYASGSSGGGQFAIEVRVAAGRALRPGDDMTFFYPSTEWDMKQPFDCRCGSAKCKGVIRGAKYLTLSELEGYFVNNHIVELLKEREDQENGLRN